MPPGLSASISSRRPEHRSSHTYPDTLDTTVGGVRLINIPMSYAAKPQGTLPETPDNSFHLEVPMYT